MTKTEPEYYIKKMDTHWAIEYVEKDYDGENVRVANVKNWLYKNGKNGGDTAKLFLEALETERDFGLSPRQLLAQRNMLLDIVNDFVKLREEITFKDAEESFLIIGKSKAWEKAISAAKTSKEGV